MIVPYLPGLSSLESLILQLRAEGKSYREVATAVRLSPRLTHKIERRALKAAVEYLQQCAFLDGAQ